MVVGDDGEGVLASNAAGRQVDSTADALAVSAVVALAAVGPVVGDRAAGDGEGTDAERRAAVVIDPAAQAVATVAAIVSLAPDGLVVVQRAARDSQGRPEDIRDAATQAIATVAATGS